MNLDSYDSPAAEALLVAGERRLERRSRQRRELTTNAIGAGLLLTAAGLLACLAPWHRSLSVPVLFLVLGTWVILERVRFPVAGGWARPTVLVFIPALFLLPTPLVPLVAVAAIVLRRATKLLSGEIRPSALLVSVGDAWFALGPAVVIVAAGAQRFAWSHWAVYLAALAAQIALDFGWTMACVSGAEGTSPRVVLPLVPWVYLVDITLAPLGLAIAAVAVNRPALVLLALSPMATLVLLARERSARMDNTLALSTAYRGTAMLLGDVIEDDDEYTGIHSRAVVDLAMGVADRLHLDPTARRNVEFGALLHDVGKIRVPKEIIHKPGHLDEAEWEIVRQHTVFGEQMLRRVGGTLSSVGKVVRHSHERWDGTGYPDGLVGEQIPIEARIVCACDAFNAMTTNRSYRGALRLDEALAELERCNGRQFDPRVVTALLLEIAEHPPAVPPARVPAVPDRTAEVFRPMALTAAAGRHGAWPAQAPASVSSPASRAAVS